MVLITADQTVHELNGVQEQREIEVEKGVMIKQGGANLEYDSLVAPEQEVALAMNTLKGFLVGRIPVKVVGWDECLLEFSFGIEISGAL